MPWLPTQRKRYKRSMNSWAAAWMFRSWLGWWIKNCIGNENSYCLFEKGMKMQSPFRLSTLLTLFGFSDPVNGRGYLGPDTLMPIASILAAVAGFFLMFGRV